MGHKKLIWRYLLRIIAYSSLILLFILTETVSSVYLSASCSNNITYEKDIKSIINDKCIDCHANNHPTLSEFRKDIEGYRKNNIGVRLDTYKNLIVFVTGDDMGSLMRKLDNGENTEDGNPGQMYEYLGDDDIEREKNLKIFKDWICAWVLKSREEIIDDVKNKWFQAILDDEAPPDESPDEKIKAVLNSIKAPEK